MFLFWLLWIVAFVVFVRFIRKTLYGPDLTRFDNDDIVERFAKHPSDEQTNQELIAWLQEHFKETSALKGKKQIKLMREFADNFSDGYILDAQFTPINFEGIEAEWVIAPNIDHSRRALYLHGGGFALGSPKGHRNITSRFSKAVNAAVLVVNYKKLPEHPRMTAFKESRKAYKWLLKNGPDGPSPCEEIIGGGDSAGGNLILSLLGWLKTSPYPQMKAAIVIAPPTDMTMSSPTYTSNLPTEVVLKDLVEKLFKIPRSLLLLATYFFTRISTTNPIVSPIHGDLSNMPPILMHVSTSEVLYGDSVRYANKARSQGSNVKIQAWENQIHDWHLFHQKLKTADNAWEEIDKFAAELK